MRLIYADELKKHKYHDSDRCEKAVSVASIDWSSTADAVPLSAIEDIKAEIKSQMDDDDYFCGLSLALQIIDKHISGKESDGQTKT